MMKYLSIAVLSLALWSSTAQGHQLSIGLGTEASPEETNIQFTGAPIAFNNLNLGYGHALNANLSVDINYQLMQMNLESYYPQITEDYMVYEDSYSYDSQFYDGKQSIHQLLGGLRYNLRPGKAFSAYGKAQAGISLAQISIVDPTSSYQYYEDDELVYALDDYSDFGGALSLKAGLGLSYQWQSLFQQLTSPDSAKSAPRNRGLYLEGGYALSTPVFYRKSGAASQGGLFWNLGWALSF